MIFGMQDVNVPGKQSLEHFYFEFSGVLPVSNSKFRFSGP